MAGRGKRVATVALTAIGIAVLAVMIRWLEASRSLRLLKAQGASFVVAESGSVLWMTLPPEQTTDDSLWLLHDMPELVHLTLSDCPITDAGLQNLGTLENLKKLDLSGTRHVNDGLHDVSRFSALTDLRLADCDWVDDDLIARLTELEDLRNLDLARTSVTDASVNHLSRIEELVTVNLSGCSNITDDGIRQLVEFPNLRHVSLGGTSISIGCWKQLRDRRSDLQVYCPIEGFVEFASLREAGGNFSPMYDATSFYIHGPVDPRELEPLAELQWNGLGIVNCAVGDDDLTWLAGQQALQYVDLSGTNVTDATAALIARRPLTTVALSETQITDRGLSRLAGLQALVGLQLRDTMIRGDGFSGCAGLRNLEFVDLAGSALTDAGVSHLVRLPALSRLDLSNTQVTDEGVAILGEAPCLSDLLLDGAPVHGEGLAELSRATTLTYLSLQCADFDEESLRHLAEFESLRFLVLGEGIGDRGVEHLARVERLGALTISGTLLTPSAAEALSRMRHLHDLKLTGRVSDELLRSLVEATRLTTLDLSRADYDETSAESLQSVRIDLHVVR